MSGTRRWPSAWRTKSTCNSRGKRKSWRGLKEVIKSWRRTEKRTSTWLCWSRSIANWSKMTSRYCRSEPPDSSCERKSKLLTIMLLITTRSIISTSGADSKSKRLSRARCTTPSLASRWNRIWIHGRKMDSSHLGKYRAPAEKLFSLRRCSRAW